LRSMSFHRQEAQTRSKQHVELYLQSQFGGVHFVSLVLEIDVNYLTLGTTVRLFEAPPRKTPESYSEIPVKEKRTSSNILRPLLHLHTLP
jgi:hypothetical protein